MLDIIIGGSMILLGIVGWFLTYYLTKADERAKEQGSTIVKTESAIQSIQQTINSHTIDIYNVTNENKEIKENYLDRFDKMKSLMEQHRAETKEDLSKFQQQVVGSIATLNAQFETFMQLYKQSQFHEH